MCSPVTREFAATRVRRPFMGHFPTYHEKPPLRAEKEGQSHSAARFGTLARGSTRGGAAGMASLTLNAFKP